MPDDRSAKDQTGGGVAATRDTKGPRRKSRLSAFSPEMLLADLGPAAGGLPSLHPQLQTPPSSLPQPQPQFQSQPVPLPVLRHHPQQHPQHGDVLPPEPGSLDDCAAGIRRLWGEAQAKFLEIGEMLEWAGRRFKVTGEFISWIDANLPFKRAAAFQILKASQALKSGQVSPDMMTAGYSTVYLITTLSQEERQRAFEAGIIRPDMRRNDLIQFKKSLRALDGDTAGNESRAEPDQLAALRQRRRKLLTELLEIRREIQALSRH